MPAALPGATGRAAGSDESGTPSVPRAAFMAAENRDLCRAARASKHSSARALLLLRLAAG